MDPFPKYTSKSMFGVFKMPVEFISESKFKKLISKGYEPKFYKGAKYIETKYIVFIKTPKFK